MKLLSLSVRPQGGPVFSVSQKEAQKSPTNGNRRQHYGRLIRWFRAVAIPFQDQFCFGCYLDRSQGQPGSRARLVVSRYQCHRFVGGGLKPSSHYGTTGSRFANRGLRCGSGKNRGAEPHTNGSRQ